MNIILFQWDFNNLILFIDTIDEAKIQLEEDEELMMNLNDEGTKLNDRSIYLFQNDNPSSNYDVQILKVSI